MFKSNFSISLPLKILSLFKKKSVFLSIFPDFSLSSPSTRPFLTFFSLSSDPCLDFRFLWVLPFPFQCLAQKSVRCAGMLLGQNWNSGRVGEGVKTEDWEALKQNTIVIVLIFISIATLMQRFSLTPGIPLLWSPPGLNLETSTGTGKVLCGFELLENGWDLKKSVVTSWCNSMGCPWGVGQIWSGGLSPRNRKSLAEMVMAAGAADSNYSVGSFSLTGSVRMRGQCYFCRWPVRETLLPLNVLSLKFRFRSSEGLSKWHSKKFRHFALFFLNSNH